MTESPITDALRDATLDIERHVSRGGWDGPVRLFALIRAHDALRKNPDLANELPADVCAGSITDPHLLFSVEQEGLPQVESLEELLTRVVWPAEVDGAALSVERIILPPSAEVNLPKDEVEAVKVLQSHPDRQDVRIVVSTLRSGQSWSAIRMKDHDNDADVLSGPELIPGLTAGLKLTFNDDVE